MKITYVGNQRFPWCTEVHLSKTLEDMGHEVAFCQEDTTSVAGIRAEAFTSQLLIYQRTWGHAERVEFLQMLNDLKRAGIPTASYHLDLYVGLERQSSIEGDPFWATEYVFTPDGSIEAEIFFRQAGINHHYIKPGVFKDECVPGTYRPELDHDVIFVGSEAYHAEWPYRGELINWLRHEYHTDFMRYGGGAETTVMRGQDLNDLYASAKVVVGDSLALGFTRKHYWSDRVYETLGRGGFLIHPYIEGMEEEFEAGNQLEFYNFNDFDGLKDLIEFYKDNPEARALVAQRGQQFVRDNCTYHNRLAQALEIMELA